jgi:hypothetical protein
MKTGMLLGFKVAAFTTLNRAHGSRAENSETLQRYIPKEQEVIPLRVPENKSF